MTQGKSTSRRRRRTPKQNRFVKLVREMPELLWLAVAALGLALFTVYPQARRTVLDVAEEAVETVAPVARTLETRVAGAVSRLTLPEILGIVLFLGAMAVLFYRLRWRVIHSPELSNVRCPKCGGEIHRVHRHTVDHLVNGIVPVRRYRCWNQDCGWEGLRVSSSHGQSAPPSPQRAPD